VYQPFQLQSQQICTLIGNLEIDVFEVGLKPHITTYLCTVTSTADQLSKKTSTRIAAIVVSPKNRWVRVDIIQRYHQSYSSAMTYNGKYDNAGAILEECREVGCALNQLDEQINNLKRVFIQVLARPDMPSKEMNSLSSQIMTSYRDLVSRVNQIKSNPESGSPRNAPQVGMVNRRLKVTIQRYQMLEADFRRDSQRAAERQYRIVRPDTKDAKVREAVSGPKAPVFEQAVHLP
jgi:hypothetical protein